MNTSQHTATGKYESSVKLYLKGLDKKTENIAVPLSEPMLCSQH